MAIEIAEEGEIKVRRSNASELLKIRRGEVKLDKVIGKAEEDIARMNELYKNCNLPESVDMNKVEQILLTIRGYGA